jgi:hypothetical protein
MAFSRLLCRGEVATELLRPSGVSFCTLVLVKQVTRVSEGQYLYFCTSKTSYACLFGGTAFVLLYE